MEHSPRIAAILVMSSLLAACPATPVRSPTSPTLPTVGAPDLQGATLYSIDAAASNVQIHVFRGGTLARMGHNHVMTAKALTGRVWLHEEVSRSGFELSFPVEKIIVDDPAARAAAGGEFPGVIKPEDREGTRRNMLRAEVLDAEQFPTVALRSIAVKGSKQSPQLTVRITIKGVAQDVPVAVTLVDEGQRITAGGQFDIQQTSFGIKPFSIALGALEVQDRLHVRFRIVAKK